ncbi:MAG: type VI secretion system ATPase TssH [Deltaproteobacteria bacterium]|nr:type VI secretion system ATPase TssH [Deltaproteobacteria bacterium]
MRADSKALVRRLTPTGTKMLESAVARAMSAQHYEIMVEHLLQAMLEPTVSDAAYVLQHFGQDKSRILGRVMKVLERMRSGNAGRPVFSETLFQWMEDTWLWVSLDQSAARIRSGALFAEFVMRASRYSGEQYPELDAIPIDEIKKQFLDIVQPSPETAEAAPAIEGAAAGPGAGPGAPAGRGDEALKRFCTNFTQKARDGKIDPIFGRHREIRQMIDILARRRKNNPIVVGEAGVGKTALIEGLALDIVNGNVPDQLKNVEIVGLDLGLLQAGAGVKGEFENRLKSVLSEVRSSAKPIIIFIDEAHTIIGAGGQQGGGDAANLLKPALARGELRTIAATTWSEYKKYFEKDAALERRFQPVKVDEPSVQDGILMLRGLRPIFEDVHKVAIRDEAVVAAVELSSRYISGRQLPDKAVDLLDTAAARVKIELGAKPDDIMAIELDIAGYDRAKNAIERDMKDGVVVDPEKLPAIEEKLLKAKEDLAKLRAHWETELAAVNELRKAREALVNPTPDQDKITLAENLKKAQDAAEKARGEEPLVHADVDADVVARVVAAWTGIPVGKMKGDQVAAMLTVEDRLRERVRGQEAAIKAVGETIRIAGAGIRNPRTPVGVMLFVGPSGVGKTETALALADALYGGERFMTTINMSEFQEKHTVSRLLGSPPGYVGYGEGGVLTEAVRQRPYSVVLLDECEKADLDVMNVFYQVFDKGSLSDGEGREIDFKNTVIILTSNLASDIVMKCFEKEEIPSVEEVIAAIRPTLSKHFKPALLARMNIVPFGPILPPILKEITQMRLKGLSSRLWDSHRIKTDFDAALIDELAKRCTESETGARAVEHILRTSLMPAVSRSLLERLASGEQPAMLTVGIAPDGGWRIDWD